MKPDPDSPTLIAEFLNEFDASAIMHHLREHGFRPKLLGTHGRWQDGGGRENIAIVVRQSESESARIAIDAFQAARGA